MRGRGGMRGMGRAPPYMRDGRGDYDRRPGLPPPPSMRNGYYDSYDRGYDYYPSRGPPPVMPSRDRWFICSFCSYNKTVYLEVTCVICL